MINKKNKKPHYVNNREFSEAVFAYVKLVEETDATDEERPKVPDYIAKCFLNIAEGLSHKSNFIAYTYREEMVMDAVENCLKAIYNYNLEAATRTGKPNAFAYFTQISWYAFLRRIEKEKKQEIIKRKFLESGNYENFMEVDVNDINSKNSSALFVDQLKSRISDIREKDQIIKEYKKDTKK